MVTPRAVSRRDALAGGLSDRELMHSPAFRRVRRGHYLRTEVELSAEEQHAVLVRAVVEAASPESVVSHSSAAVLHGLPVLRHLLERVHLTRNRQGGGRTSRQLLLHGISITDDEIVLLEGMRVTSVARTVIDLARSLPFEWAVMVGDAALHADLVDSAALSEQLLRAGRRTGVQRARAVLPFLDGRSESPGESWTRVLLHQLGLPSPHPQAELWTDTGNWIARVDLLLPELGIVIEFDGAIKYQSDLRNGRPLEQVILDEKKREDRIRALGWLVVRITWSDLHSPDRLRTRLASAATTAARSHRTGRWTPTPPTR
ncbi:hypothetical protein AB0N05_31445 [Nocardia sp. NPDC051030]|uniref:hypothetical protein n=1 Tax=Nocardia sp. NPDC051030 TaxID=3155162 RepID=UPI00343ACA89